MNIYCILQRVHNMLIKYSDLYTLCKHRAGDTFYMNLDRKHRFYILNIKNVKLEHNNMKKKIKGYL